MTKPEMEHTETEPRFYMIRTLNKKKQVCHVFETEKLNLNFGLKLSRLKN